MNPPAKLTLPDLIKAGFARSAVWTINTANELRLDGDIPKEPGIYLFVVDGVVKYVGVAGESLARRVGHYVRNLRRATRMRHVHLGIDKHVRRGDSVALYTLRVPAAQRWETRWLPIDRLMGLERGLIETLNPKWNPFNLAGRQRRATLAEKEATSRATKG